MKKYLNYDFLIGILVGFLISTLIYIVYDYTLDRELTNLKIEKLKFFSLYEVIQV